MFSSDRNIETLHGLLADMKRYVELRVKYVQLDFVSKMTVLAAAFILGAILFMLLMIVILFLSYACARAMAPALGGMPAACAVVALFYAVVALLVYACRKKLIINPVANFLGQLFLTHRKKEK